MANMKIDDLPPATLLDGTENIELGTGERISLADAIAAVGRSPRIQALVSTPVLTPTFSDDLVKVTAQAENFLLASPSGTPVPGMGIAIRIKDNGVARAIGYAADYRPVGVALPTATVPNKTLYLGMIYNADDAKMDVVAVSQEA